MKIVCITLIINPHGLDDLLLYTNLPDPIFPFKGVACLKLSTAQGTGRAYAEKYFPEAKITDVIDRAGER